MNAFDDARTVEARGLAILEPFLRRSAHDGHYVMTSKGALARFIQDTCGDAFFNSDSEKLWSVEIKVEEEDKHSNFFLETWSNRNLESRASNTERGSNPGWMLKQRADFLFYYFLQSDELYIIPLFKLQRWAFRHDGGHPRIDAFEEKRQSKRWQANDTWGRCVPISVVQAEVGFRKVYPQQVEMFEKVA